MSSEKLDLLFRVLPFPQASELHQRIQAGLADEKTRRMLRRALWAAGLGVGQQAV
ncbi:hypothetical protein LP417_35245 (plasmid) [Polaromonas sp. P1-6]|nr:hypothetical protein LP417_35245 [Polaromonas sp. P1-6]